MSDKNAVSWKKSASVMTSLSHNNGSSKLYGVGLEMDKTWGLGIEGAASCRPVTCWLAAAVEHFVAISSAAAASGGVTTHNVLA